MTPYHLGAIGIAAIMVLACSHSNHCTADSMDKVIEMAKYLIIGIMGNAGLAQLRRPKKPPKGKSDPGAPR